MIAMVYNINNEPSRNMAEHIIANHDFEERSGKDGRFFEADKMRMYEISSELISAESADSFPGDVIYFLSSHFSAAGRPAMTTHPTGNWNKAELGGQPKTLSTAAATAMLSALRSISKVDAPSHDKTYEATHHGPTITKPSLFVEVGGDREAQKDKKAAALAAEAFYSSMIDYLDGNVDCAKIVLGIGGVHYPSKFTALALEKGYAFSHIMPKHGIMNDDGSDNLGMLSQAVSKTMEKVDGAVIDWKSVGSPVRTAIVKKLDEMGLDYERA